MTSVQSKTCYCCKVEKPIDQFNLRKRSTDGHQNHCRECQKQRSKNHYNNNRDTYLAKNVRRKEAIRDLIKEAKSVPCADCKQEFPPYCNDFDHLSDKEFNLGHAANHQYSLEKVKAEIAKCEVVCSNCHRIRTYNRLL